MKKRRPIKPDAVKDAEAIVEFYQKRLDEAEERLGAALAEAERKKVPRRMGAAAGN